MSYDAGASVTRAGGPSKRIGFFYRWAEARWYKMTVDGPILATESEAKELGGAPDAVEQATRLL